MNATWSFMKIKHKDFNCNVKVTFQIQQSIYAYKPKLTRRKKERNKILLKKWWNIEVINIHTQFKQKWRKKCAISHKGLTFQRQTKSETQWKLVGPK